MKYLSKVSTLELFRDKCIECGACMINCAFSAIRVDKGVECGAAIINGMITGGEPSCDCSGGRRKAAAVESPYAQPMKIIAPLRGFHPFLLIMLCLQDW